MTSSVRVSRVVSAACVSLAVSTAGAATTDFYFRDYQLPLASGTSTTRVDIDPFVAPYGNGPLVSVRIDMGGDARGKFTQSQTFGGTVTARTRSSVSLTFKLATGETLGSFATNPAVSDWPLTSGGWRFQNYAQYVALSLPPATLSNSNPLFARFLGPAAVGMDITRGGGVELLYPPTPTFIGIDSGTTAVMRVTYEFVPAPGALGLLAMAGAIGTRRTRG